MPRPSLPPLKVALIAGARPNFMKIAPLIRAFEAHNTLGADRKIDWQLIHTGQHYDAAMSDIFFSELGIPAPHVNLNVGSGSHAVQPQTSCWVLSQSASARDRTGSSS